MKILGAGLMCIDIVHSEDSTKIMNGGSCANVMSVLSQIGFDCSIIREKYSDCFEKILSKTLSSLGVNEIIYKNSSLNTPKIIELINSSEHEFLTSCPRCGEKTLKLHLPTDADIDRMGLNCSDYDVFYCDRASTGIRKVMDYVRSNHGIVVYEPNSSRNIEGLMENAKHADIVKFSKDRICFSIAEKMRKSVSGIKLIISTESAEGLTYSYMQTNGNMSEWTKIPSEFNGPIIDSSGAGDWLTAGFISELLKSDDLLPYEQLYDTKKIFYMLNQGMKYSQICCTAIGAQGVFYSDKSIREFSELNKKIIKTEKIVLGNEYITDDGLCPLCLSKIQKAVC